MEEFEQESPAKKYAIIGISVGLALLLIGIGVFVIMKRRSAGLSELTGATTTTGASSNTAGNETPDDGVSSQPQGGQKEPPVVAVTVVPIDGPVEQGAAGATVFPPTSIDPTLNRLLTDEEKAELNYPKNWVVRKRAAKVEGSGALFVQYIVERKPTDSDEDGLPDSDERSAGTDATKADTDGDGLLDGDEVSRGTDPRNPDSDGDGLRDGDEIMQKNDPLDRSSN